MILKGNIRAAGQELANHLLNARDNDRVELAGLHGFAGDTLHKALAETEAIASATNCRKYLYSLSINPSQPMTRAQYEAAIDRIGERLGLSAQPHAIVFHVKEGREHCHVAWSRIDAEKMQAVHNAFDRQKLRELARELCHEFGHALPPHLAFDRGAERHTDKDKTQAEIGQEKRTGESRDSRREKVTDAYRQSDTARAFQHALAEQGYILAQGDKRGFVLVDSMGEVHSLTRQIEGVKAKEIAQKFRLDDLPDLPSVQQAKEQHALAARQRAEERAEGLRVGEDAQKPLKDAQEAAREAAEQYQQADAYLKSLRDAHRAELKAERGQYQDELKTIREREAERIDHAKAAIKEAYRPEWRDLFKRHREELAAYERMAASPKERLRAMLEGRAGDAFDFGNRNTLAGMFRFVVRGEMDKGKLEKRHEAEKQALGNLHKLAMTSEIRGIKADSTLERRDARQSHDDRARDLERHHREDVQEATKARDLMADTALETLRASSRLAEEQGRDLSGGEKAEREGFGLKGFGMRGFGKDDERDDEIERVLKPPSRDFTP